MPLLEDEPVGAIRPSNGIGRRASTALGLQVSGMALQYALQLALARMLGGRQFGAYALSMSWARLGGTATQLGFASTSLRFVPEHRQAGRLDLVHGAIQRFRQIPLALGALVAAVGSAVLAVVGRGDPALLLALWLIPLAALAEVQVSLVRAFQRVFAAFFPWLVLQPGVLLVAIALSAWTGIDLDARGAIAMTAASYALTIVVQSVDLRRAVPAEVKQTDARYDVRLWIRVSTPVWVTNLVHLVFSRVDVIMVGLLVGQREAGIYAVAWYAGSTCSLLQTAVNAIIAPRLSNLYWAGKRDELLDVMLTAIRWIFIPSAVLTAAVIALSEPLLRLFGPGFAAGRSALIVLAIGQLVGVSAGSVGWLMNLTGHQVATARVFSATAALTVVGYLVLLPWLGIVGAAIANGLAVAVRNVALNALVRRRLDMRISVRAAFRR